PHPGNREDEQDLLRRVGDGGERVGGEDRERRALRKALVTSLRRRDRPPDEEVLERVELHGAGSGGPTWAFRGPPWQGESLARGRLSALPGLFLGFRPGIGRLHPALELADGLTEGFSELGNLRAAEQDE